jgi:hypothetical protein
MRGAARRLKTVALGRHDAPLGLAMDRTTARELRERIAHYKGLQRMAVDSGALAAIARFIAEAEERIRQLEAAGETKRAVSNPRP